MDAAKVVRIHVISNNRAVPDIGKHYAGLFLLPWNPSARIVQGAIIHFEVVRGVPYVNTVPPTGSVDVPALDNPGTSLCSIPS